MSTLTRNKWLYFLLTIISIFLTSCGGSQEDGQVEHQLCHGDMLIGSEHALQAISHCTSIQGNLSLYEVESLQALSRLESVQGSLTIGYRLDEHEYKKYEPKIGLTDLSGLKNLTHIGGSLIIANNPILKTLDGLDGLLSIGGDLFIGCNDYCVTSLGDIGNPQLREINALGKLKRVNGDVKVVFSPSLENLHGLAEVQVIEGNLLIGADIFWMLENLNSLGLEKLERVDGNFIIDGETQLENLEGLQRLQKVNGVLRIESQTNLLNIAALEGLESVGGLAVRGNVGLKDLQGLNNLKRIGEGGLEITYNAALTSLSGLGKLYWVEGNLEIAYNKQLQSIHHLESLKYLGSSIIFSGNSNLADFAGFPSMQKINGDLKISENPLIAQLDVFREVEEISGNLTISSQGNITDLNGFASIRAVGKIELSYNEMLASIDSLQYIRDIEGAVTLAGNQELTNLHGLAGLESVGSLSISGTALSSLNDLANLKTINGRLELWGNAKLTDITAFHRITRVGELKIKDNDLLTQLDGLEALERVDKNFSIEKNEMLESLNSLVSLRLVGWGLLVLDNPKISDAQAEEVRQRLEPFPLDLAEGEALYQEVCSFCHGSAGNPFTLNDREDFSELSQDYIENLIENEMHSRDRLCSGCARNVAGYVVSEANAQK